MPILQITPPSMMGPAFSVKITGEQTLLALIETQAPSFLAEILDNNGEINRYIQCYLDGRVLHRLDVPAPANGGRLDILTSLSGG